MTKICIHCDKKAKYERQAIVLRQTPTHAKYFDIDGFFTVYECKKHRKQSFEKKRLKENYDSKD